jgi:hypothetical protein
MKRSDVNEAAPLLVRMLTLLLSFVPPQGRPGVGARTAIGDVRVNAAQLCFEDTLGTPLDNCFTQSRLAGVTWQQFETVRRSVDAETPQTLGGVLVQGACVRLCLAVIAEVLAATTFISRQQVDVIKMQLLQPFPSVVVAYKLYEDASRCDKVRNENKIVHPAFCPRLGEALSS